MTIRALVVDDTIVFRTIIAEALRRIDGVEVVGSAPSGRSALVKIKELKPDLVTLDIEMPEMDGLQVLDEMKKLRLDPGVIVVSSFTVRGGACTISALEKGAFDFITKPSSGTSEQNREAIFESLSPRIKAWARKYEISSILKGNPPAASVSTPPVVPQAKASIDATLASANQRMQRIADNSRPEMVLIGVSTGGPPALTEFLPRIPGDFPLPIVIVQHMPPLFTQALAESLGSKCALRVREAASGDTLAAGVVYIAPGGKQMKLSASPAGEKVLLTTDDPPENNCKPSVDYLFRSASVSFPGRSCAFILTGMGSDGTLGLRLLKRHGCRVIAQDEASCVVYGMPKAAVDAGVVDEIVPLSGIAAKIIDAGRKARL
jgi:two-component system, chemotaxis family, protein-glutamate methylesterase/glutaminase